MLFTVAFYALPVVARMLDADSESLEIWRRVCVDGRRDRFNLDPHLQRTFEQVDELRFPVFSHGALLLE